MAGRVEGKVALITGGSSGIGKATALLFGREGAKVAIADYNVEGGERTAKTIRDSGGTASFYSVDVANPEEIETLIKKVVETYGRLDHAFNNVGIEGQLGGDAGLHDRDRESGDRNQPDLGVRVHEA